ncbi:MAG: hypothetical protein JJT85_02265 [Chromatiales bacterium]|nr:hypothetical protein [Chromatiales bacterium]
MRRALLAVSAVWLAFSAWAMMSWHGSYRPLEVDLVEQARAEQPAPVGQVGVLFTGLLMPETLDDVQDFFLRIASKPARTWPWPFRVFVQERHPVVLLDVERFHEQEAFTPTRLVDAWGRDHDENGRPWIDYYHAGELSWVAPRERLRSGHFITSSLHTDWPTFAQKPTVNARLWYYGVGLEPPGMPHAAGVRHVVDLASEELTRRHGPLVIRQADATNPGEVRAAVFEMLDSGMETLVLASTFVTHGTYKVLGEGGSFYEAWRYVEEWQRRNRGREITMILAPSMGSFQPVIDGWVGMLRERLDTLPEGSAVDVLISSHGMPWDRFPDESYHEFSAPYYAALRRDIATLLAEYPFSRTRISQGQDIYADEQHDPQDRWVSTNEAYRAAAADGFDVIITLPSTFYSESSDTMFAHALYTFEGLQGFDAFATIRHGDWNEPLVREFRLGETRVIYNGLPVGRWAPYVATALADSVSAVLD